MELSLPTVAVRGLEALALASAEAVKEALTAPAVTPMLVQPMVAVRLALLFWVLLPETVVCPDTPLASFQAIMDAAEEFGLAGGRLPRWEG